MTMVAQGTFKPVIDCVLQLDQALEGLRLIRDREVIGKVVITP
jgi:alcohol dehydrogenase